MDIKEATEILLRETGEELILDVHQCGDFVEFITTQGGDVHKFRVYEDGDIFEK